MRTALAIAAAVCTCTAGLVGGAHGAAAQGTPFTLDGFVIDLVSKQPVIASVVELKELKRRAFTDSLGSFTFPGVVPGHYTLTASSLGYATVIEAADFREGLTAFMQIPPRPVLLAALEVTIERAEARRRASGFSSDAFGSRALTSVPETTLDDFLRTYAHVQLVPCSAGLGQGGSTGSGAECMQTRGAAMPARIYLDENPLPRGESVLESYYTGDVARVEVYRGLSMIRIYTPGFLERVAKGKASIDPVCLVCTGS